MVRIAAIAPVLPPHVHAQSEITATIAPLLSSDPRRVATIQRIHASTGIETRHLALPLDEYAALTSFTAANDAFARVGTPLAAEACRRALADAGLEASDVDYLLFTSITGIATPSMDALLVERLGLADSLVSPATLQASVVLPDGRHPLPAGTVLGVPASAVGLTGALTPAGVERVRAEASLPPLLTLPRTPFVVPAA